MSLDRHLDLREPGLGHLEVSLWRFQHRLDALRHFAASLEETGPPHLGNIAQGNDSENARESH
jgi:hypothetical protein